MKKLLLLVLSAVLFAMCLTACGDSSSMTDEDKNNLLKTANSNAKLIFAALDKGVEERHADMEVAPPVKTSKAVSVDSFKNSSNKLEAAVYDALEDSDNKGYAYIDYDGENESYSSFVQWSESESSSVIGQYPNEAKTYEKALEIKFGTKA